MTIIKILQARRYKGITLRQLEVETSISRTKLNRFERGESLPDIDEINEIAHALKVPVTDLYEYHYIEKNPQSS